MADQFRAIAASHNQPTSRPTPKRKDPLAQKKIALRAEHDAATSLRREGKAKRKDESRAEAAAFKAIRAMEPFSKQAKAEQRQALKREARRLEGAAMGMCDHGIWRCRVCHPVSTHKD